MAKISASLDAELLAELKEAAGSNVSGFIASAVRRQLRRKDRRPFSPSWKGRWDLRPKTSSRRLLLPLTGPLQLVPAAVGGLAGLLELGRSRSRL